MTSYTHKYLENIILVNLCIDSMGETINAYRILVGKPEGKRPLGRPRRRWVDDIKMDFRETGWDGRD
jgi:hypothetical protein